MSEKLTIGLLSPFFQPIPGYEQAAINLDMNLVIVTPKRVDWAKKEVAGLLWNGQEWVRDSVSIPRSLYNRYYGPKPKIVSRLELVIGKDKIFNHVTRFNKWTIHQVLSKSSLQPLLPYRKALAHHSLYLNEVFSFLAPNHAQNATLLPRSMLSLLA